MLRQEVSQLRQQFIQAHFTKKIFNVNAYVMVWDESYLQGYFKMRRVDVRRGERERKEKCGFVGRKGIGLALRVGNIR